MCHFLTVYRNIKCTLRTKITLVQNSITQGLVVFITKNFDEYIQQILHVGITQTLFGSFGGKILF